MTRNEAIAALIQHGFTKDRGWRLRHQPTDSVVSVTPMGQIIPVSKDGTLILDAKVFRDVDRLMVFLRNYKRR